MPTTAVQQSQQLELSPNYDTNKIKAKFCKYIKENVPLYLAIPVKFTGYFTVLILT
jgi:hypothetical protein